MEQIIVGSKKFIPYLREEDILQRIEVLAKAINKEYQGKPLLFIGVLNGSFMFASDLLKKITVPCELSFIRVASYEGTESSGSVKQVLGLQEDIFNKHVILLEDIVDSGLTMEQVLAYLQGYKPQSLEIATLLLKPECLKRDLKLPYVGFEIPNKFVVGYGLDYDGQGRNLKDIYQLAEE